MLYREFGKTGKKVSAIGFGGMRFTQDQYANGDYSKCVDTILYASQKGINYFDTGAIYTDNVNEAIFGAAFPQIKEEYFVTSKASIITTGEKTQDEVLRRIEQSLKAMKIDKINFMYLWCILDYEAGMRHFEKGGVMDGFRKAKDLGMIEHICLSTHANGKDVIRLLQTNEFEGVLLGYNVINFPYREEALHYAKKEKIAVVTMNPLGGGIIPENKEYFSFLKNDEKDSAVKGAIRFNVAHEEITVTLLGINQKSHIDEALEAITQLSEVTDEKRDFIKSKCKKELNTLCTGCNYCKDCPSEIPIAKIMDVYNMHMLKKSDEELKDRVLSHWRINNLDELLNSCIECGKCEEICTQKLPIIKRLNEIKAMCK